MRLFQVYGLQRSLLLKNLLAILTFQAEKIMDEPDKPLPEDLRLVTTEDIERVHSVETFEELKDLEQHFKLYYGRDTQAMQEWSKKKRKVNEMLFSSFQVSNSLDFAFVLSGRS